MNWNKFIPSKVLFFAAVLLLFVLSYLLLYQIKEQALSARLVNRTHIVRLHLEETVSHLKEAESAQRGFLLTKDSSFYYARLQDYHRADSALELLRARVGNTYWQGRVDSLRRLVRLRVEKLEDLLRLLQDAPVSGEALKRKILEGGRSMEAVQACVNSLLAEQQVLLERREKRHAHNRLMAPASAWMLISVMLGLLAFAANRLVGQLYLAGAYLRETHAAHQALLQTHALLENAEQAAVMGSWQWNLSSGSVSLSPNYFRIFGLEPAAGELSLDTVLAPVHPDDRDLLVQGLTQNGTVDGKIAPVYFRVLRPDGALRHMEVTGKILQNDQGERVFFGNTRDMTELIQAIDRLKRSEVFSRNISELAPNAIYVVDRVTRKFVYANKLLQEFHGYSEEELAAMGPYLLATLLHPDDLAEVEQHFHWFGAAADGEVVELQFRLRHRNGQYRQMLARETVFKRDANGTVVHIIGVATDLTELKKAQQKLLYVNQVLEERNAELKHSNEELASFNYIASHDLQEPLRKIQVFSNFIEERETGLTDMGRDHLRRMQVAATRMRALIHDLLDFSRVSMEETPWERVDLNGVLQQALFSLKAAMDEKEALVHAGPLPVVRGVGFQLQQLFQNIIGNAVKYGKPATGPLISVTCTYLADGRGVEELEEGRAYYRISIVDNGIGFEQQFAHKIFELFQRLHTHTNYPGTGIGLAICKKIAHKHGGHIQARSKPGEGSVFEVFLPAAI
ncbi:PAS domain-containing protein [Paraflavisolibacter sp. H34]|uniref:PAS domain-containing protein n=1 Tax=Huijunlia imazamoxiresistens TaxID=3127457 RepID=UPI00301AABBD